MNPLNCYQYSVNLDEQVIKSGFLHASNDVFAEKRLRNEVLSKVDQYTSFHFSKAFCQKCSSDHDVAHFYYGDHEMVLCQSCRVNLLIKNKKGAV